jgi:hypothetical protein
MCIVERPDKFWVWKGEMLGTFCLQESAEGIFLLIHQLAWSGHLIISSGMVLG